MRLAIIVGVSDYQYEKKLPACKNDADLVKGVFDRLQKFDDICFINDSPKGKDVKQRITDFVSTHKGATVDELVFYYSGHGGRFDDDFFYIFSDFKTDKREVTGLRNTELDGLFRNLAPELTVKIVDACYSGSMYIKSESDIKPIFEKSAKDNDLKKVYFLHSSSESEASFATSDHSYFTYSFLESLTQSPGDIRYRDIMAFVADNMMAQALPKPIFVVQADNTEIFGSVELDLIEFTKTGLAIKNVLTGDEMSEADLLPAEDEIFRLVLTKSANEFCTRSEAESNLIIVKNILDFQRWPENIQSLFDVEVGEYENTMMVANGSSIGSWLQKNSADNYFASPRYDTEDFYVDEYKELPKKPSSSRSMLSSLRTINSLYGNEDEKDYKLEKVNKQRSVLAGFQYTTESPFKIGKIVFKPKHTALENYSLIVVAVFSRRLVVIFYSIEHLGFTDWETLQRPKSKEWKNKSAPIKSASEVTLAVDDIISDASEFIRNDIKTRLSK